MKKQITVKNHPLAVQVKNKTKDSLLIMKPYFESALEQWKKNKQNKSQSEVEYNLNYFKIALQIIDGQLFKFNVRQTELFPNS